MARLSDQVEELIGRFDLAHRRVKLRQALKPSLRLRLGQPGFDKAQTSRVGGCPALADPTQWPTLPDGRALTFLAQVNLAELPRSRARTLLPKAGLLSFFYDTEEQPWGDSVDDRACWRVLFEPDPGRTRLTPESAVAAGRLPAFRLGFVPDLTVPAVRSIERDALELREDEWDRYWAFRDAVVALADKSRPVHRMLGHPDAIQGCMQRTAQFRSRGLELPPGVYSWYEHPRAAELIPGAFDWRLLLQIDSDERLEVMWGDVGRIYFWITETALRNARFEDAWFFLQCY